MRNPSLATLLALAGLVAAAPAQAQKAVIVVRHAEKFLNNNDLDNPLAKAGFRRSLALADALEGAGVTAVIVSPALRTRQTAQPLLDRLKGRGTPVVPQEGPGSQTVQGGTPQERQAFDATVAAIHASGPQAVVLVVTHSEWVPEYLRALAGPVGMPASPDFAQVSPEFGRLFVIATDPGALALPGAGNRIDLIGSATPVARFRYGPPESGGPAMPAAPAPAAAPAKGRP